MLKNYIAIVKEVKKSFLYNFGLFSAVSTPVYLLSVALLKVLFPCVSHRTVAKTVVKSTPCLLQVPHGNDKGRECLRFQMSALAPHIQSTRLHFASTHGSEFVEHETKNNWHRLKYEKGVLHGWSCGNRHGIMTVKIHRPWRWERVPRCRM